MTDSRIIKVNQTALNAVKALNRKEKAIEKKNKVNKKTEGLDDAIQSQRNFLNGSV